MSPAAPGQVEDWISALHSVTVGQRKSEDTTELAFDIYVTTLGRYPADVAREACSSLMVSKWFPTLGEVIDRCDKLVSSRREMLASLEGWKPETEKQRLEREADDWLDAAYKADHDKVALARRDPDAASEAAEFSPIAWANYKRLTAEARAL